MRTKMIEGNAYDCIIMIGPSHREYFKGASIYPGEAYETPLGVVPINDEIREELLKEQVPWSLRMQATVRNIAWKYNCRSFRLC